MISKLIEINFDTPETRENASKTNEGVYEIKDYAESFVNGLDTIRRAKFKKMLESGVDCGRSIASTYGIEYKPFIEEVKKIMEV